MRTTNSFALLIFIAILGVGVALAYAMHGTSTNWESIWIVGGAFVVALVVARTASALASDLSWSSVFGRVFMFLTVTSTTSFPPPISCSDQVIFART